MRQSNNRKSRDVTAFLYERLSRDDNLEGESIFEYAPRSAVARSYMDLAEEVLYESKRIW